MSLKPPDSITNDLSTTGYDLAVTLEAPLNPNYAEFGGSIQAVIDSITPGTSVEILVPGGIWDESLTLQSGVTLRGIGQGTTFIRSSTGDVLTTPAGSVQDVHIENLTVRSLAGGGRCFHQTANLNQAVIHNVAFIQDNAAQEIWLTDETAGFLICSVLDHCDFTRAPSASVPGIKWVSNNGEINKNTIGGESVLNDSGAPSSPFIWIEERSTGSIMGNNIFRDINAENCRAGIIRAMSQYGIVIDNVNCYDLAGATSADLFWFGKSSVGSALKSRYPIIRNVTRIGAQALGGGFNDVKFVASECDFAHIEDSDHSSLSTGFAVDLGPNVGTTFRLRNGVTVTNLDFNASGLLFSRGAGDDQVAQQIIMGTRLVMDNAAPAVGTWAVGDRCGKLTPVVGQPKGWLCTVAGTPGTWVSEGNL